MTLLPKTTSPFAATKNGVRVAVRLTPKANVNRVEGLETGADGSVWLKVRVRSIPENGKANMALIKLLAKEWAVPARNIVLQAGAKARFKQLEVACNPVEGLARLQDWFKGRFD